MEAEAHDAQARCTRTDHDATAGTLTPQATVIAVDAAQVHVRCPRCGEIHHHGAGGGLGYRGAHCTTWPPPPDYQIVDPLGLAG